MDVLSSQANLAGYKAVVLASNLFKKALEQKNNITDRPADLLVEKFEDFKENLKQYCNKLKIKDLSNVEENILTFILIPYGSEKIFKKMSS